MRVLVVYIFPLGSGPFYVLQTRLLTSSVSSATRAGNDASSTGPEKISARPSLPPPPRPEQPPPPPFMGYFPSAAAAARTPPTIPPPPSRARVLRPPPPRRLSLPLPAATTALDDREVDDGRADDADALEEEPPFPGCCSGGGGVFDLGPVFRFMPKQHGRPLFTQYLQEPSSTGPPHRTCVCVCYRR